MKRLPHAILSTLLLTAALRPAPVQAAVFERDWKTPGDGLLTYDDVNKREWLDVSLSLLSQFPGGTLETQFQSVLGETEPGGAFGGFAVGRRLDMLALAESAGVDVTSLEYAINRQAVGELIELLGASITFPEGSFRSMGFLDELYPQPSGLRQIAALTYDPPEPWNDGSARLTVTSTLSDIVNPTTVGVMLYRVIPEPRSPVLTAYVVWWLIACRRKLRNARFGRCRLLAISSEKKWSKPCARSSVGLGGKNDARV